MKFANLTIAPRKAALRYLSIRPRLVSRRQVLDEMFVECDEPSQMAGFRFASLLTAVAAVGFSYNFILHAFMRQKNKTQVSRH